MQLSTTQILTLGSPAVSVLFSLGFYFIWTYGARQASYLLYLAGAFVLYAVSAASQILRIPDDTYGANTLLTAVFFMASLVCLIKGLTLRYRATFDGKRYLLTGLLVLLGLAYFFYVSRNLPARIYILNFGVAGMVLWSAFRIRHAAHQLPIDRAFFWAYVLFGLSFFPRTFMLVNPSLYKDISRFEFAPFWLALQLSLLLFAVVLALLLLAAAMLDIIGTLQQDRDIDGLTKLFNRRHFEERSTHILNQNDGTPVSLIICDLDRFKSINDNYGHQAGDSALIKFSQIIRRCIRKTDIACRFGGEEFVILMPRTHLGEAVTLAERLRHDISHAAFPGIAGLQQVTCSFGVTTLKPGDTLDDLIRRADERLYKAKNAGRNCVVAGDRSTNRSPYSDSPDLATTHAS